MRCSSCWGSSNFLSPLSTSSRSQLRADGADGGIQPIFGSRCRPGRCSPHPCSAGSRRWWGRRSGSPPPHRQRARSAPAVFVSGTNLQHIPLQPKATTARHFAVLVIHQLPQLSADVEDLTHLELDRRLEIFTECRP